MAEIDLPGRTIADKMEAGAAWQVAMRRNKAKAGLADGVKLLDVGRSKDADGRCPNGPGHMQGAGIVADKERAGLNQRCCLLQGGHAGGVQWREDRKSV